MKTFFCLMLVFATISINAQSEHFTNQTLNDCIKIALEKNKLNEISRYKIEISKAHLKQAQSAKYPQVDISSFAYLNDEKLTFTQPPMQINMPPLNLGQMNLILPTIELPAQFITLADNKSLLSEANVTYPLYTGGKISAIVEQAKLGFAIAQNDSILSEREIKFNVRNTFYAVILAGRLVKISSDALRRFEATYNLTESLYTTGSERVSKLDYLKNKMTLSAFRSMAVTTENNFKTALSALKFYMGLQEKDVLTISEANADYEAAQIDLFVKNKLNTEYNIDVMKVSNAKKVFEQKINEANSDYYPSIALVGNFRRWDNSYNYASFTKENQNIFTVGVGLKWSVFNGFRSNGKVEEMQAELSKLESQRAYLLDGVQLQKTKLLNELNEANEKIVFSKEAMLTAIENTELSLRAYQNELSSVSDFIQAQLFEAILSAQYENSLYQKSITLFKLEQLFGDIK